MQQAINQANATTATSTIYSFFPFVQIQQPQPELQFLNLQVTRANLVQDTIAHLYHLTTQDLKKPIKVRIHLIGSFYDRKGAISR